MDNVIYAKTENGICLLLLLLMICQKIFNCCSYSSMYVFFLVEMFTE